MPRSQLSSFQRQNLIMVPITDVSANGDHTTFKVTIQQIQHGCHCRLLFVMHVDHFEPQTYGCFIIFKHSLLMFDKSYFSKHKTMVCLIFKKTICF